MKASFALRLGLLSAVTAIITGCASRSVELVSEPNGLEIQTLGGETLGTTPVILRDEALEKATSSDGLLSVRFVGPGYLPQTLIVEVRGADSYRMQPIKLDESFFRRYVLRDFSGEHNAMMRDMLNIQGLIRTKKFTQAEQALVTFQERFPTVAVSQVMLANLALIKGDKKQARRYLLQAQALDPKDPVILRMLGGTPADIAALVDAQGPMMDTAPAEEESTADTTPPTSDDPRAPASSDAEALSDAPPEESAQ